jgi:hypothetical protein
LTRHLAGVEDSLLVASDLAVDLISAGFKRCQGLGVEHVDDELADLLDVPGSGSGKASVPSETRQRTGLPPAMIGA